MTEKEAIRIARRWVDQRVEVRRHLIAAARRDNPEAPVGEEQDSTVRKLYQFPSDLSEARLLALIGGE